MALPAEIRDLEAWAADGDREDPETLGLDRDNGWPLVYEQIGGKGPEREVWNQLLFELTSAIIYARANGLPFEWHQDVDYVHPAFCKGSNGVIYASTANSGPALGNSTNPLAPAQTIWRPH